MKKIISTILVVMILLSTMVFTASAASSETESNDTYSTADTFSLNSTISGKLGTSGDVDFYKITASSTGKLAISFSHTYTAESNVYWYVWIYYFTGGKLVELSYKEINGTSNEKIDFPVVGAVKSGAYYIKVATSSYYGGNTCNHNYSIKNTLSSTDYYEKEFNNSYADATVMTIGKTYGGYLNTSGDTDFYKVVAPSDGKLSISFNHTYTEESDVYWCVWIYYYSSGNYTELSYKEIYGTSKEKVDFPVVGAVKSGAYYVKVATSSYYGGNTCNHEYNINSSFSSTDYYEKEFNNSYADATVMTIGKTYGGYLNNSGDTDFYKFSLSSSTTVTVNFAHTYTAESNVYWNVDIYNYSNGAYTKISGKTIYGGDSEDCSVISKQALSAGTYYIKVATSSYYGGNTCNHEYSVTVTSPNASTTTYKLSYNANGGSGAPSAQTGSTSYYVSSTTPTRSGYTFLGWSKSSSASSASYTSGDKITLSSNTTLYAVWKQNSTTVTTYKLSYDANGGSGAPSAQTGSTTYYVSSTVPTRSGYTFLGWSKSSSASSANYTSGDKITLSSNTTLYAVWKQNSTTVTTYKLSYDANGGSGAPSAQTGSTTYYVSSTTPTRSGYTFLGWSTSSSASSAGYTAGDKISISKNTTLYAVWEKVEEPADEPTIDMNFSFMDIWNSIIDFFKWVIDKLISLFK